MLVVLRLSRAATCVKWSPLENKFAVGSGRAPYHASFGLIPNSYRLLVLILSFTVGAKLVAVCYYDEDQDFWVRNSIFVNVRVLSNHLT